MSRVSMGSPDYVYMPWSDERCAAASVRVRERNALLAAGIILPITSAYERARRYRDKVRAEILANRADIDAGLYAPENIWRPRPKGIKVKKRKVFISRAKVTLSYPFIAKKRDDHADLLAVNSLVPRGLPGREDVCQEIMLALWEGLISLSDLRANVSNVRAFIKRFKAENLEAGGYAISLDAPMSDGRSWHDVLAA